MFTNVKFITSATNRKQWPEEGVCEFLFCGKSNVGKSSLINALCNRKNLAFVGKTAGMTRLLNFYSTNQDIRLVDAPGYGYYEKKKNDINNFENIIREYFQYRKDCKALLLLINIQRELDDQDEMLLDMAAEYGIPAIIVLTKADKLSNNQRISKINKLAADLEIDREDIYVTSSSSKQGVEELYQALIDLSKEQ
ncbi:MAG: YihA family ribosome biogenesis GTP-binding protein [Erysipelotrichaceae bacterium]|nr:YihA family ribosome biogenesis GTP-binding protein [Erysipelotrichaceae bacterium]